MLKKPINIFGHFVIGTLTFEGKNIYRINSIKIDRAAIDISILVSSESFQYRLLFSFIKRKYFLSLNSQSFWLSCSNRYFSFFIFLRKKIMKELEISVAAERLSRLSDEETALEIGLSERIEDITKLLQDNRSILKNDDPSQRETIDELITKIDEVSFNIEYAIGNHGLSRNKSRKFSMGCMSCCMQSQDDDPYFRIKCEVRELYDEVKHALEKLSYLPESNEKDDEWKSPDYYYNLPPDRDVVGLTKVKSELLQCLIDESEYLKVISLCGVGGVGKTTLAHEVFQDPGIELEFKYRIWIPVSSKFNTKDILMHILSCIESRRHLADKPQAELADDIIYSIKKGGRFLFVLDDVWSTRVLDELQRLLLSAKKKGSSSSILLTTRKRQVAEYGILKPPFVYTVRRLMKNDAWKLFMEEYRRHNQDKLSAEKENIGKEMVKRCEGVPLAIIKLGQELAGKESLDEWSIVHQNLMSFLTDNVLQVLAPSFDDLPDHLKLCFIYLGLWPEDSVIDAEKLYHFWIVEGLVKPQDIRVGVTALNVAEQYLTEPARMSMVEVEEEDAPSVRRLKFCRVTRMMRQLCISKGNQINFSHRIDSLVGSNSTSSFLRNKTGRLFVCLEKLEDSGILAKKQHTWNLHSLHILDAHKRQAKRPVRLSGKFDVEELRLLRLLDFDGAEIGWDEIAADGRSVIRRSELLEGISKLVRLRYLSFKRCILTQLPAAISNLLCLQVLDLRVDDSITEVILPNVLWKMRKMKHLYLPRMFRTYTGDKLRLDGLTELETLENFITRVCNVTDLQTLTELHNLAVKIDGDLTDLQFINEHLKQPSNKQIQLSIDVRNFDCFVDNRHSVIRELLQYRAIRIFCIEGHIRELPPKNKISPSLTKLVLIGSELEKDPMESLSKLPNLRVLVLDDNAFEGTDMVSPPSGFTELKRLEILNLIFLESWTIQNNSVPKLSSIKIENCPKLRIPDGFKFLAALKKLEIAKMPKSFANMLCGIDGRRDEDTDIVEYVKITFPITDEITRSQDEASSSDVHTA
ncbi:putative disease resistance RPP8-like protein 2 isoform X2 [Nicotiana tabacum]|uniref:Disease resistance RPP8-like protein 2 isoform X2 n=1 Tax=Nicotiana tabacum TaxID=4097 RepID=A0AC58UUE3_TOBAC